MPSEPAYRFHIQVSEAAQVHVLSQIMIKLEYESILMFGLSGPWKFSSPKVLII